MTVFQAMILGFVQGLTEFLPVSSKGHLVLGGRLLGLDPGSPPLLAFDVLVHLATLVVVVMVYRCELAELLRYLGNEAPGPFKREGWKAGSSALWRHPLGRFLCAVLVMTVIIGVTGGALRMPLERLFGNVHLTGLGMLGTAALTGSTFWARERWRGAGEIPFWAMIVVGLAQSLALAPGISRSGATIAAALLCGMDRRSAGSLSFIAAIPAVLGAAILELRPSAFHALGASPAVAGFVVATVTGLAALLLLLGFVRRGRLWWFAPYSLAVGLLALFL